jgi:hypothetical protein
MEFGKIIFRKNGNWLIVFWEKPWKIIPLAKFIPKMIYVQECQIIGAKV